MATVDLVFFDAGGGHRAAALALPEAMQRRTPHLEVRLLHLFKVLDRADRFRRLTGMAPEDLYNVRLQHGLTLGLAQELKLLQGSLRLLHGVLVDVLVAHWRRQPADLVVSLVPNFNRAMGEAVAQVLPGAPYVTVLTDFADYPPHFWIEPTVDQHVVCGTRRAVEQAHAAGVPAARVHEVRGMLLRGSFSTPSSVDRDEARRALGLDPGAPVGLVMFGGAGSRLMGPIARQLADTQLILLCGRNVRLAKRLRALPTQAPRYVVGYTSEVAHYMRLADFFVGKPGPGSLSEAIACGLPVIVTRNAWTMPQERYNTDWVSETGVGLVTTGFRHVGEAVARLLADLPSFRAAVARVENDAATAVPALLERLLAEHGGVRRVA